MAMAMAGHLCHYRAVVEELIVFVFVFVIVIVSVSVAAKPQDPIDTHSMLDSSLLC